MSELDVRLLLTAIGSVLLLVALTVSRIRLHPLLALLIVSIGVGLVAGMDTDSVVKVTINGAVGIIIALGAMLGKILANAGVTEAIADAILRRTSDRVLPRAMAFVSFIVGIPMFFEVGLVVVLPLVSHAATISHDHW
jgi:GntP family gluconate:H+ symporter